TDDTPEFNITDEASNSDEPNNASASDISDNTSKSDVNSANIPHNLFPQGEKLRDQEASLEKLDSSRELEELMSPPLSSEASTYVPSKVVQGLLQRFSVNSIEGENIEFINSNPSYSAPAELAHLLYQASKARKKSIKAKQEEILSWGRYSE
ncbi:16226_t:CDS:2, partial [Acaulospora morrowiae]